MKTELIRADDEAIAKAAKLLAEDEVVAFPTETVYGLGANALHNDAVAKIFAAKGRPSDNPLIVHISDEDMMRDLVADTPEILEQLMAFWPGPLTLVMKKKDIVPDIVTAGLDTVGIRMPSHPVFAKLIKACGFPIAAPSANSFGRPSPTTARHVKDDMNDKIPMILDGGQCDVGIESTILDISRDVPMLLRPGKITVEEIEAVIGPILIHDAVKDPQKKQDVARAPGMKYRHYSPDADVILVMDSSKTEAAVAEAKKTGRVGIITNMQEHSSFAHDCFLYSGSLMEHLFFFLRELDCCVDTIIVEGVDTDDLGVMNRLKKAATKIIE